MLHHRGDSDEVLMPGRKGNAKEEEKKKKEKEKGERNDR